MAANDFDTEEARDQLGRETLAITKEELLDYMEVKNCGSPCESCGHENWTIPEVGGEPSLLTMSTVRGPAAENWFFWMVCNQCGNTRFNSAGHVWYYLKHKDDPHE